MTKLINLTPHEITFIGEDGNIITTVAPSGSIARVGVSKKVIGMLDGIPIKQSVFGEVEGLPEPEPNTVFIVSSLVAARCPERADVMIPDDSVRDGQGRIIGCKSLGRV
jgi:hypothetical protein